MNFKILAKSNLIPFGAVIGGGDPVGINAIMGRLKIGFFTTLAVVLALALLLTSMRAVMDARKGNPEAWKERIGTLGTIFLIAIIGIVSYRLS